MGETCHTTSGGVESHRLNIEREAWATTPPAILHYIQQNVIRETINRHRQSSTYCIHKHLHRQKMGEDGEEKDNMTEIVTQNKMQYSHVSIHCQADAMLQKHTQAKMQSLSRAQ